MHPSLLYLPGAPLSLPELTAARIDGLLIEVGDGYMPPDIPEGPAARLASLAPILSPGYAASGPTAAWVHGVGDGPPRCHHLQRVAQRRARVRPIRDVVLHDRQLEAGDIEVVSGVPVTTRVRTLVDLIVTAGDDPESALWMRRLAAASPELVEKVRVIIQERTRMPGKRAALARIAELAAYEDVTRYTS